MTTADQPGAPSPSDASATHRKLASALSVHPSRGLAGGMVLILLGVWTGFIHFVGPYFDYQVDTAGAWAFTVDRLWFGILPGVAAIVGGFLLVSARDRATGSIGGWVGLATGVWLVLAPTLATIWETAGPDTELMTRTEQIGFFYGLGAVVTVIAAFSAGRMAVRSIKD